MKNVVKKQIEQHILDCVYDYNENQFSTIQDACKHLYSEFNRVANYANNIKRIPNDQLRFQDYLQGIPFHFHFYNQDIENYLNSLGINPLNKKYDSDKMWHTYSYYIYSVMLKNINL